MTTSLAPRLRLKARRGALVLFVGLFAVCLVAVGAICIDMSRLANLEAELQVAADAGAHAGSVQIMATPLNQVMILDTARSYATRNTAMQVVPTIDVAEMGVWNSAARTFTPGAPNPNAVRLTLSVAPQGLIMEILGVGPPVVHATAIGAPVIYPGPVTRPGIVQ